MHVVQLVADAVVHFEQSAWRVVQGVLSHAKIDPVVEADTAFFAVVAQVSQVVDTDFSIHKYAVVIQTVVAVMPVVSVAITQAASFAVVDIAAHNRLNAVWLLHMKYQK